MSNDSEIHETLRCNMNARIDANTEVTGKVSTKRVRLGSSTCNFEIEYADDSENAHLEMYLTLPNCYRGSVTVQKYKMRSIIEAIQELNRRTSTIRCNYKMDDAINKYDYVNDGKHDEMFACDMLDDGLPAAHKGEVDYALV